MGVTDMNLVQNFTTSNPCYTNGQYIRPQGLMLHSVGCPQENPDVFRNTWDKPNAGVGVHYVVGAEKAIQCLKDNMRAWHCGGAGNDRYISCEMTEPNTIRYTGGSNFIDNNPAHSKAHVVATYNNAVELFAEKCKQYGFDPMTDIISHKEGALRGIASNHGDPDHILSRYGLSMDTFRRDVKAKMQGSTGGGGNNKPSSNMYRVRKSWSDTKSQIGAYRNLDSAINLCKQHSGYKVFNSNGSQVYPTAPSNGQLYRVRKSWGDAKSQIGAYRNLDSAKALCDRNRGYSVFDEKGNRVYDSSSSSGSVSGSYVVKINVTGLNIRSGAGTGYSVVGSINDKGCYTIVETKGEWGKLKSGKGWIYMGSGYATRI